MNQDNNSNQAAKHSIHREKFALIASKLFWALHNEEGFADPRTHAPAAAIINAVADSLQAKDPDFIRSQFMADVTVDISNADICDAIIGELLDNRCPRPVFGPDVRVGKDLPL